MKISLERYLITNSNKTAENFAELKSLSGEIYHQNDFIQ